jgi:hypothetical protein
MPQQGTLIVLVFGLLGGTSFSKEFRHLICHSISLEVRNVEFYA